VIGITAVNILTFQSTSACFLNFMKIHPYLFSFPAEKNDKQMALNTLPLLSCGRSGDWWSFKNTILQQYATCYWISLWIFSFIKFVYWYFSALTLMAGQLAGHPACKKTEWWGAGMVICLGRGANLLMAQLMSLPFTVSCSFWVQLTRVVLVKGSLNRCWWWCILMNTFDGV